MRRRCSCPRQYKKDSNCVSPCLNTAHCEGCPLRRCRKRGDSAPRRLLISPQIPYPWSTLFATSRSGRNHSASETRGWNELWSVEERGYGRLKIELADTELKSIRSNNDYDDAISMHLPSSRAQACGPLEAETAPQN